MISQLGRVAAGWTSLGAATTQTCCGALSMGQKRSLDPGGKAHHFPQRLLRLICSSPPRRSVRSVGNMLGIAAADARQHATGAHALHSQTICKARMTSFRLTVWKCHMQLTGAPAKALERRPQEPLQEAGSGRSCRAACASHIQKRRGQGYGRTRLGFWAHSGAKQVTHEGRCVLYHIPACVMHGPM